MPILRKDQCIYLNFTCKKLKFSTISQFTKTFIHILSENKDEYFIHLIFIINEYIIFIIINEYISNGKSTPTSGIGDSIALSFQGNIQKTHC